MRLPRVTADKIIKLLKKKGFFLVRQSGSHMIFRNERCRINFGRFLN
ncbi:MAG: type II toxin-antitoxin system HicA family toxin [Methanobacteriota archaeon]|nr:type II toxin-antitoxin system HicA family toxin [Candidatus Hydrothermarchaeota archaeon]